MNLNDFPRLSFAHLPTPLEPMTRLSGFLGGPEIYIKRDDCTGLGSGGNKTRKLEFLMAEALSQGADTVLTIGAVQSNHVRQTAAAAAQLGLDCMALLETEVPCEKRSYQASGNILLDGLFGAELDYYECGTDMEAAIQTRAETLREAGRKPYLIPLGGSNPVGALGYVDCARELVEQIRGVDDSVTHIVHATGSGGTQAGLLLGLRALGSGICVTGISVSSDEKTQVEKVRQLLAGTAGLIGFEGSIPSADIRVLDEFVGEGYGMPTTGMREAVELCARLEGILLDPVYSGKAMAGLIEMIRRCELDNNDSVVFLHTGGSAGLFAYDWYFNTR